MSGLAGRELEEVAAKYARKAITLDSQGNFADAVVYYQNAIETLLRLVELYPNDPINRIYLERVKAYRERVKALQVIRGVNQIEEPSGVKKNDSGVRIAPVVEIVKASFEDLLMTEKPRVSMNDIVGLEEAKLALRQAIVYPCERPDLFPLGWPRGILLFGPPGCGKTMLAASVANEIDGYFISIDAANIMSKWLGDAEKNVKRLFTYARSLLVDGKPVIVFIDEADSLLAIHRQEVSGEARVRNQFLKEIDGIVDKGRNSKLYILAATNKPWLLDEPFLRRFQKRIYVPPPDLRSRKLLFERYTAPLVLDKDVVLDELAEMTEGYTASDIRDICQDAQLKVVTELFESGRAKEPASKPRPITMDDFKYVTKSRKPSLISEHIRLYEKWNHNFGAT